MNDEEATVVALLSATVELCRGLCSTGIGHHGCMPQFLLPEQPLKLPA
jgi:hypothetical protein